MEYKVSLHPGQVQVYNSPARFKVVAAGRRWGKSHFAGAMLGIGALEQENYAGYRLTPEHGVYYIAPTFDQAKRVMWPKLREILRYSNQGGFIKKENVNDGWLELISGRRIYIKGADNPDSLRGIGLSYVVLDEYADMKPDVWELIVRPALADVEGRALFIGTPKGKNHFYKLFMSATDKPTLDETEISPWEEWEAFHFKSLDNPFLNPKEIAGMMTGNLSREAVRQELEASFASGAGKFVKPEWFKVVDALDDDEYGSIYVTVDLAGYARQDGKKTLRSDETVICITFVGPDGWTVLDMKHGHWDVRETALNIVRTCSQYPGCQLGIEKGALMNAVGPYLDDYMREFSRYVTPQPLSHGNTKKLDRIVWALQGRAERGDIKLVKGDWNQWLLDQIGDLGDPLSHDDGPDALAYVDQMASVGYIDDLETDEWEPLDLIAGY